MLRFVAICCNLLAFASGVLVLLVENPFGYFGYFGFVRLRSLYFGFFRFSKIIKQHPSGNMKITTHETIENTDFLNFF